MCLPDFARRWLGLATEEDDAIRDEKRRNIIEMKRVLSNIDRLIDADERAKKALRR